MNKIGIIGGGPIGLYVAKELERNNIDYLLFESNEVLGGQIVNLYPHKKFLDVEGFYNKESIEFINDLVSKININKIKLNEKVLDIKEENNVVILITNKNKYEFNNVVIATGLGCYSPRTMGLENEDKCSNILYSLKDFNFLKDKRVVIFGGGDSALDWAREISLLSNDVYLIHRRLEFRGNKDTIKDCKNLKVHLPYIPFKIVRENNICKSITIKNVNSDEYINIDVDYILVNYGSIPVTSNFNYEKEGNFYKVKDKFKLSNNVFCLGDASYYENKIKRIDPSKKDADLFIDYIKNI